LNHFPRIREKFLIEHLKKAARLGFVFASGFDFESLRGSHGIPGNFLNIASLPSSFPKLLTPLPHAHNTLYTHTYTHTLLHAGGETSTISTSGFRCNVMETRRESKAVPPCCANILKLANAERGKKAGMHWHKYKLHKYVVNINKVLSKK